MSLLQQTNAWIIALLLLVGMMLSIWLGIKTGNRFTKRSLKASGEGSFGDISSLNGLLFFLLAFTFGMSGSRYEARKSVIVEEANCIGTALLRSDLYSDEARNAFRIDFKEYVELRIAYFEKGIDEKATRATDSAANVIALKIWERATHLAKDSNNFLASQQMIPALNDMMDITTTRMAGEKGKVPETIVWMLFALAFASAFFMGYASVEKGKLDWLIAGGFCLLISVVVFITLDLDRPHRGLIKIDSANQNIIDLRKNFE